MLELLRRLNLSAGLAALLLALPLGGTAQEARDVVSNRLAIGGNEASLYLEFADGEDFQIALADGDVRIDGSRVGSYATGDRVDTAWRALLGEIATLSNGALASALRDWTPPEGLSDDARSLAEQIDRALETALAAAETEAEAGTAMTVQVRDDDVGRLLRTMLRSELVPALAEALEDIDYEGLTFYIDEDVTFTEPVDGPVMVVDGNVVVAAEIDGDVVVVRGSLTLDPGAHILGDVKLVDARMYRDGGTVMGDVEELDEAEMREGMRSQLRDEIRSELRRELRNEFRGDARGSGIFSPFAGVVDGIASLFGDLMTFLILGAVGLGLVFVAKDNLEVVADTARRTPGRAAMVGLAGGFLVLPAWVLGILALVVSVVGLIALPFWLILFPLAVALAAGLGYYAVARNIGEWVAEQRFNGLGWLRASNTAYAVVAGVGALLSFSVVGHLVGIVPGLGFFEGLVTSIGGVATFAAVTVGFGAVLLTRGGKQPDYYGATDPFDADLWTADPGPGAKRDFRDAPSASADDATNTADVTNDEDGDDA